MLSMSVNLNLPISKVLSIGLRHCVSCSKQFMPSLLSRTVEANLEKKQTLKTRFFAKQKFKTVLITLKIVVRRIIKTVRACFLRKIKTLLRTVGTALLIYLFTCVCILQNGNTKYTVIHKCKSHTHTHGNFACELLFTPYLIREKVLHRFSFLSDWIKGLVLNVGVNLWCYPKIK